MAVHFNPPPGWLVPPGFSPSSDWHPDPAWPAAPVGWVFWVEAAPTPPPVPVPPTAGAEAWSRHTPGGGIPLHHATAVVPVTPGAPTVPSAPSPTSPPSGPTRRSLRDVGGPPAEAPASSTMILPVIGAGAPAAPDPAASPAVALPVPAAEPAGASARGPLAIFSGDDEPREERTYMRWLLPVGVGVGGVALGLILGLGVTLKAQSEAGDATAAAAKTTEQMAADRAQLDAERADLDAQLATIATSTEAVTAREAAVAAKENELNDRETALREREAAMAEEENNNGGGWQDGKVNGIYLTCDAVKRDGKAPLKQGDEGFNPALDWDGNGLACER
jgi:hypothetical protein